MGNGLGRTPFLSTPQLCYASEAASVNFLTLGLDSLTMGILILGAVKLVFQG